MFISGGRTNHKLSIPTDQSYKRKAARDFPGVWYMDAPCYQRAILYDSLGIREMSGKKGKDSVSF